MYVSSNTSSVGPAVRFICGLSKMYTLTQAFSSGPVQPPSLSKRRSLPRRLTRAPCCKIESTVQPFVPAFSAYCTMWSKWSASKLGPAVIAGLQTNTSRASSSVWISLVSLVFSRALEAPVMTYRRKKGKHNAYWIALVGGTDQVVNPPLYLVTPRSHLLCT